jgi:hypothetical protein
MNEARDVDGDVTLKPPCTCLPWLHRRHVEKCTGACTLRRERIRQREIRAEMPGAPKYPSPTRSCIHHSFALQAALRNPLPLPGTVLTIIIRYFYPRVSPRDLAHPGGLHAVIQERAIPLVRSPTELPIRHENYANFARFLDTDVFGVSYALQLAIEEEMEGQQTTAILVEAHVALRAIERKEASEKQRDKVRRKRKW